MTGLRFPLRPTRAHVLLSLMPMPHDKSGAIRINLTKWSWILRRGEGGGAAWGGPLWSPACLVLLLTLRGTLPHPRATIKAHSPSPLPARPYGHTGFLSLFFPSL